MIFGMAYLLVPSFVGRTLVHQRVPAIHFGLAYAGTGAIVVEWWLVSDDAVLMIGVALWSLGVIIFMGELLWTTLPTIFARLELFESEDDLQQSARLWMLMIPVAIGYLLVGTLALLGRADVIPTVFLSAFPSIIHYYGAGFGGLLIFSLGTRLIPGFFNTSLPKWGTSLVLISGGLGPTLLGTHFWMGNWFEIGALLEAMAMTGYAILVALVYWQSDRPRIGFYGILLGAIAGAGAVGLGVAWIAVGGSPGMLTAHATLIVTGFFGLTIIGYVYQFFPVTSGQFMGASQRTAVISIGAIGIGVFLQAIGQFSAETQLARTGALFAFSGAIIFWYLVVRRNLTY